MFQEMFPILSTPDLPRALTFYRDLLGATVTYQFPPTGEPGYVGLELGRSHLGIGAQSGAPEGAALSGAPDGAAPEGAAQSGADRRFSLWVYCDDCDTAVAKLRAAGVPVVEEPADQPWGERMATVTDPDGNTVIIATRQ